MHYIIQPNNNEAPRLGAYIPISIHALVHQQHDRHRQELLRFTDEALAETAGHFWDYNTLAP